MLYGIECPLDSGDTVIAAHVRSLRIIAAGAAEGTGEIQIVQQPRSSDPKVKTRAVLTRKKSRR